MLSKVMQSKWLFIIIITIVIIPPLLEILSNNFFPKIEENYAQTISIIEVITFVFCGGLLHYGWKANINNKFKTIMHDMEVMNQKIINGDYSATLNIENIPPESKALYEQINKTIIRLENIIFDFPLSMFSLDCEHSIKYMNKMASTLTEVDPKHAIGRKCYELLKMGDCNSSKCGIDKCLLSGQSELGRTEAHPAGKDLKISYVCLPVKDENGKIIGAHEHVLDQTSRVKAETSAKESLAKMDKIMSYLNTENGKLSFALQKLSEGNLTERYTQSTPDNDTADSAKSFAAISKALDATLTTLASMLGQIQRVSTALASGSEELTAVSDGLLKNSEHMADKSGEIASGTEQMSVNINTMAAAVEEMSVNVGSVSSGAEEMSANMSTIATTVSTMTNSINDISKNAQSALAIGENAMELSGNTTSTINKLGIAAKEIGKVTDVIKRIAEQTNLLALNATIEAASAGEAGKGFAVVANEVKELASQSAQAADNISEKVEGIRNNTNDAIAVIKDVAEIITKIVTSVRIISTSVDQQNKSANGISANVNQASLGVKSVASAIAEILAGANDMAKRTGEVAIGSTDVAENSKGIKNSAKETYREAQEIKTAAVDLAKMAGDLQTMTSKFLL